MSQEDYLIWKEQWAPWGWYKPGSNGYTGDVTQAGRYTKEEAGNHVRGCSGEIVAVKYGSRRMVSILKRCDMMAYRVYKLTAFIEKLTVWFNRHENATGDGPKRPPTIPDELPESVKEKIKEVC